MNRKVAKTVIVCVAFIAVVLGLTFNRILAPVGMSNEQLRENGLFVYDVPRRFDDFSLIDQHHQPFTKDRLRDQWTLIFFGYTYCPDICPLTLANIRQFDQMLADTPYQDDTQVVMVSVDPRRDTPEKLGEYMSYFGADYIGATGEYIDIFNLASHLNVSFSYLPAENDDYQVSHSGEIILINPMGDFHGFFKYPHEPAKMLQNYTAVRENFQESFE
ncbi:MAG: SCO family protein [Pseudomonadales bacterium]|nr:SCO family protein [Pseudomonadales bacterium]